MEKGNRKIQYLITYSVSLISITMGAFYSWPAPIMPKFRNNETDFEINDVELSWMVAMTSPGFMAGSLTTRFLADRFGRKTAILLNVVPSFIGTLIVAFALKAWLLYLARFLWGFGAGMIATVGSLYVAEIVDKEVRGSLTLVSRFMFSFGNLLMMCIGPFVAYRTLNFMLLSMPLLSFLVCLWIPESPYHCLKEGKVHATRKVLARIRIYNDEKMLEDDLTQMQADVKNEMRHSSSAKALFTNKRYRKAVIIAGVLKFTQICTGQLILPQYLGLIMLESNADIKLPLVFIIFGVVRFLVSVMSSVVADKVGRRPLLIYSYLGTGISLAMIGLYFFLLEIIQIDGEAMKPYSFIPFVGIIASNIISTIGYASVIVLVAAEIFPLNVKSIASTSIYIFGGMLNFVEGRGYQGLKDVAGLCGVFWFIAAAAFAGTIFSALYLPETKGKSLKEIQIMLQGDMYEYEEEVKLNKVTNDAGEKYTETNELLEISKKVVN